MKRFEMRKLSLILAIVLTSSVAAWAQFDDLYASDDVMIRNTTTYQDEVVYVDAEGDEYIAYEDSDDYDAYAGGAAIDRRNNDYYEDYNYSRRINRFHRGGGFNYNSVVFIPTNRWNSWNRWGGGFGFNDPWCDPFDPWCDPFYNGFNGGTNIFISVGARPWGWNRWNSWNSWNRWNRWNQWGAWGYNGWGGNVWGRPAWNACPNTGWVGNRVTAVANTTNNPKGVYRGSRRGGSTVSGTNGRRTDGVRSNSGRVETRNGTTVRTGARGERGTTRTRVDRGTTRGGTIGDTPRTNRRATAPVYSRDRRPSSRPSRNIDSGSRDSNRGVRSNSSRSNSSRYSSGSSRRNSSGVNRGSRSRSSSNYRSSRSSRSSGSVRSSRGSSSRSSSVRSSRSSSRSSGSRSSSRRRR